MRSRSKQHIGILAFCIALFLGSPLIMRAGSNEVIQFTRPLALPEFPQSDSLSLDFGAALGDVNEDGNLDVVCGFIEFSFEYTQDYIKEYTNNFVDVFPGDGNGRFGAPLRYLVGASNSNERSFSVSLGDLNGDSHLDLISAQRESLEVFYGKGTGEFDSMVKLDTFASTNNSRGNTYVLLADFNGDNSTDILALNNLTNQIPALFYSQSNSFVRSTNLVPHQKSFRSHVGLTNDFNEDTIPDLILANREGLQLCLGQANGSFVTTKMNVESHGRYPSVMVSGDVNGDGFGDFLAGHSSGEYPPPSTGTNGSIAVLLGNGDGTFSSTIQNVFESDPVSLALSDFNADGILDIVSGNAQETASFFQGNGDGTFSKVLDVFLGVIPMRVLTGDFNNDSKVDVFVLGLPNFDEEFPFPVHGFSCVLLNLTDYHLKKPDILWRRNDGPMALWMMNQTNFTISLSINEGKAPNRDWRFAGLNDLNNDGDADLLWQHKDGRLALWLMNGTNTWRTVILRNGLPVPNGWDVKAMTDLNADEDPDLLLRHVDGRLAVWLMDGTNFVAGKTLRNGQPIDPAWRLAGTGDFDGDSKTDLLWEHWDRRLMVSLLDGTDFIRSFTINGNKPAATGWKVQGASDFNNDSRTDLLWQHNTGRTAVWLMNGTNLVHSIPLRHGQPAAEGWRVIGLR